MRSILIAMPPEPAALERVRALPGIEITFEQPFESAWEASEQMCRRAEVMFCKLPPTNIAAMQVLRFIQIHSAGFNQLLGLGLPERGIRAANGTGNFDVPIAEWNIAMMINLARDLRGMIRNQESGTWLRTPQYQREVRGLIVGIWGYGGIGRETARLAKAMGMQVHAMVRSEVRRRGNYQVPGTGDPEGTLPDRIFRSGQETEFLSGLDFLILSLPLNSRTRGIIGEPELQALPRHAYLLNPARGPLVQEDALLRALAGGWIAGAALDTHYHYPMPADHPLWKFPNVIMTPHISGSDGSPHYLKRVWDIFATNLEHWLCGQALCNELTVDQLRD